VHTQQFALKIAVETCANYCSLLTKVTPKMFIAFFDLINDLNKLIALRGLSSQWNRHSSVFDSLTVSPEPLSHLVMALRLLSRSTTNLWLLHLMMKLLSAKFVKIKKTKRGVP
jgi:hypothetical protein